MKHAKHKLIVIKQKMENNIVRSNILDEVTNKVFTEKVLLK